MNTKQKLHYILGLLQLREARDNIKPRRLSLKDVATHLGVTHSNLHNWVRGFSEPTKIDLEGVIVGLKDK